MPRPASPKVGRSDRATRAARPFSHLARTPLAVAVAGVVATAAPACGGGGDRLGRTVTLDRGEVVRVVGDEYSFDPETVIVGGGSGPASLEITLENRGALAHNLKLLQGDRTLGGTTTFQGGETRGARITLRPGDYEMVCTVGNHAELGMVGSLTIR